MAKEDESLNPSDETHDEQNEVILGIWDHEKTPTLIKDLEHSINSIEFRCKQLVQLLIYYRQYFNELNTPESQQFVTIFKNEAKYFDGKNLVSESDPDISFRKKLIKLKKLEEKFEKNFEDELLAINKELTTTAEKLGIKDNIILFSTEDYIKDLRKAAAASSWTDVRKKFLKLNTFRNSLKSASSIPEMSSLNSKISKITFSDLDLYRKLSKLNFQKIKIKKVNNIKVKKNEIASRKKSEKLAPRFRIKKPNKSLIQNVNIKKSAKVKHVKATKKSVSSHNFFKKRKENEKKTVKRGKSNQQQAFLNSVCSTASGKTSQELSSRPSKFNIKKKEMEINFICDVISDTINKKILPAEKNCKVPTETASDLSYFAKKKIPFIACSSTAKSYNIGTNIQQLLSKAKYIMDAKPKKKPTPTKASSDPEQSLKVNSKTEIRPTVHQDSQDSIQEFKASYPWGHSRTNSLKGHESDKSEENEEFCTAQQSSKSISYRKHRSKYTRSWAEGFVEYHKSTMEQYTNGQESVIKSESKRAYAVGSKIMVSDCQRTDFYHLDNQTDSYEKASGDGTCNTHCNKLKNEWLEVYKNFSDIYGKYNELKEQLENDNSISSNMELTVLSQEIDNAIEKYTDFLRVYSKFLHLKDRLKSLKIACESKTMSPFTSAEPNCQKRLDSCKVTSSMTLKKAYRHLQVLQEKIKLVH